LLRASVTKSGKNNINFADDAGFNSVVALLGAELVLGTEI
jgi:hypothetical protein